MNSSSSVRNTRILFILSTVILSGFLLFLSLQIHKLINAGDSVNHVNRVSSTLQRISTSLSEAESAQRGFLLTADTFLLTRQTAAFQRLNNQLGQLDSLVAFNTHQTENLSSLHKAVDEKRRSMSDVFRLHENALIKGELHDSLKAGIVYTEKVKKVLLKMAETEGLLLETGTENFTKKSFTTLVLSLVLVILALCILFLSYIRLNKSLKESQKLQNELGKEKNLLESILDSSMDVIAVYDKETRFVYYSHACELLFKKKRHEVIGRKLADVFRESANSQGMADLKRALNGETIHNAVYHSPLWDRYYENFLTPLRDEKNGVYAVLVVAHDLTEIYRINDKIIKNNQALEEAQRVAKVGSWEWKPESGNLYWSPYMRHIYGVTPDEDISFELFISLVHSDDKAHTLSIIQNAIKDGTSFEFQHRIVNLRGELIYMQARGECEKDENGKVIMMRGTGQDISQLTLKEELARQSEDKFNKLFQFSPFSISLADKDGKYVDVNDNFLKTFGFTREELIGRTSADIGMLTTEMRHRILEEVRYSGNVRNVELEIVSKNGNKVPVLVSIEKIQIANETFYLNAINDIADRKRAEEKIELANARLQKMNKELESFAYVSSHDLQEPLRKIQTFSSRLLEKEYEQLSEAGKDQFRRIQKAARRMQTLIEDLLTYSRTNTEERVFEIVEFKKFVLEVLEEFNDELNAKNATVHIDAVCGVRIIPFQFRQLLQNLISNSIKFADPVRPLVLNFSCHMISNSNEIIQGLPHYQNLCHIQIRDNGIGFEEVYNEKVFEVFQRLHGRDKYAGTGIGLSIVKKIVDNHGGYISAHGVLNEGSAFNIYIPC